MTIEVQFAGDHNAFPLWGRDDEGYFDLNLPRLRGALSAALAADLEDWARRWAEIDGGDRESDDALADDLIAAGRQLATRVGTELGPEYVVSVRWDAPR